MYWGNFHEPIIAILRWINTLVLFVNSNFVVLLLVPTTILVPVVTKKHGYGTDTKTLRIRLMTTMKCEQTGTQHGRGQGKKIFVHLIDI